MDQHAGFQFVSEARPFRAVQREPLSPQVSGDGVLPLAGIRVLELTANWGGTTRGEAPGRFGR